MKETVNDDSVAIMNEKGYQEMKRREGWWPKMNRALHNQKQSLRLRLFVSTDLLAKCGSEVCLT